MPFCGSGELCPGNLAETIFREHKNVLPLPQSRELTQKWGLREGSVELRWSAIPDRSWAVGATGMDRPSNSDFWKSHQAPTEATLESHKQTSSGKKSFWTVNPTLLTPSLILLSPSKSASLCELLQLPLISHWQCWKRKHKLEAWIISQFSLSLLLIKKHMLLRYSSASRLRRKAVEGKLNCADFYNEVVPVFL